MANEITVRTQYTFLDDDGTVYNRDHTYYSDAATTASRPKRYIFTATPVTPVYTIEYTNNDDRFANQLSGASLLMIVNREDSRKLVVILISPSLTETRVVGPGQWLMLDVCEGDQGVAFTYGAEALEAVQVYADWQSAKGELLSIFKAAS